MVCTQSRAGCVPIATSQQSTARAGKQQTRTPVAAAATAAPAQQTSSPAAQGRPWSVSRERYAPCLQRLCVAVDIDEVLGRFLHCLNEYVRDKHGFHHDLSEYSEYDFKKVWGCSQEFSNHVVHDFFQSAGFVGGIPPLPGAFYSLQRLKQCHELHVVTSRQHCIEAQTREWVTLNYPHLFDSVNFGNHWALEGGSRRKSEICRDLGATVLIDDNPSYAADCAEAGMDVILFDWQLSYPWSKAGPTHPRVRRASDWQAVELAVSQIAQAQLPAACAAPW